MLPYLLCLLLVANIPMLFPSPGFPVSRTLEFHSNSPDPVSFLIRVDGDGRESPLTYEDYLSAPYQEMSAPPCPREFLVEPERGVVQPGCSARIKVIQLDK